MAQGIHRLSKTAVEKTTRRGLHADGGGLYLQVAANGSRSWLFRYSRNDRTRHVGLGPIHAVDVNAARECRRLLHEGVDPLDHRKAERAAIQLEAAKSMTFDECRDEYIDSHKAGWKSKKHAEQWRSTLKTYVTPKFGDQLGGVRGESPN